MNTQTSYFQDAIETVEKLFDLNFAHKATLKKTAIDRQIKIRAGI